MDVNLLTPHLSAFAFPTECFEKIRRIVYEKLEEEERDASVVWLVNNCDGYINNPHFGTIREDFFAALQTLFEKPGCFGISELRLLHCYSMSNNNVIDFYYDKLGRHCELRDEPKKAFSEQVIEMLKDMYCRRNERSGQYADFIPDSTLVVWSDHIRSATQFAWLVRNLSLLLMDSDTERDTLRKIIDRYVEFYDEFSADEKYDSLDEILGNEEWYREEIEGKNDELIHTLTRDLVKMSTMELSEVQKKLIGKICLYIASDHEILTEAFTYSPSLHDHAFRIALKIAFETGITIMTRIMRLVNCVFELDNLENRNVLAWKFLTDPRLPDIMHKCENSFTTFIVDQFHQSEMLPPLLDLGWSPVFLSAITQYYAHSWPQFEQPLFISTARRIQLKPQESGGKYKAMEESPEWKRQCRSQDTRKPSVVFALIDEDDF